MSEAAKEKQWHLMYESHRDFKHSLDLVSSSTGCSARVPFGPCTDAVHRSGRALYDRAVRFFLVTIEMRAGGVSRLDSVSPRLGRFTTARRARRWRIPACFTHHGARLDFTGFLSHKHILIRTFQSIFLNTKMLDKIEIISEDLALSPDQTKSNF